MASKLSDLIIFFLSHFFLQPVDSCLTQFDNYIGCDGSRAKSYFCRRRHYTQKTHTLTRTNIQSVLMAIGESDRRAAAQGLVRVE
jgi:hypothetical protein